VAERKALDLDPPVLNFLYRNPDHYDRVYPVLDDEMAEFCLTAARRYLGRLPSSVADFGCGTGRDLGHVVKQVSDCVGVDLVPEMIEYARQRYPNVVFHVADMRTVSLERRFDVVICLGSTLLYSTTNSDLCASLDNLAAHTTRGGILILNLWNAAAMLASTATLEPTLYAIEHPKFQANAISETTLSRRTQTFTRRRVWTIVGKGEVVDRCTYRLLLPRELEHFLDSHGFRVLGMFDNITFSDSDLSGDTLYVVARRLG
jgi:SAM-dependent methyltransferase